MLYACTGMTLNNLFIVPKYKHLTKTKQMIAVAWKIRQIFAHSIEQIFDEGNGSND